MSTHQDFYDMGWKHALNKVQESLDLSTDDIIKLEKLYK